MTSVEGRGPQSQRMHIAKWGFGMAPISTRMRRRYDDAVQHLCDILAGNLSIGEVVPELLSEAKGMANRCVREDQWDWFTVFSELGSPPRKALRQMASHLVSLRRAAIAGDEDAYAECLQALISTNVLQYLHVYQNGLASQTYSEGAGWIYILSTREQPEVLKIGRTDRSVADRVREINSATGVLVPWAARRTYRVLDAQKAEAEIHRRLVDYRLRMDREFFALSLRKAVEAIDAYLEESQQRDRWTGRVIWFDRSRGFGFVSCDKQPDVFLHRSQLSSSDQELATPGAEVTFLLGRRPQGPCAIDAKISGSFAKIVGH
ncbi:GIY-YIG nuclease family protein [Kiritimatiella glycovorans]|uniref:Cold shock-like protein CspJ n=1 Tax=Kiritimatiella glycovorans TaxID=1307763 RepID=A0A0G3EBW8_9BACT|nr:GIY-YIG nuclease family protein [Kiritimatiella glycovorans]AKJ63956.1 Cold shock-like protein CspJ [Kiritimatiella glycovorans]